MEINAKRRLAAVDLGSNTLLLLIAELENETIRPLYDEQQVARLGKGLQETGRLQPDRIEKALEILADYRQICEQYQVDVVLPVATAAVREAENREDFLKGVQDQIGWSVRLLSGEEEARLSFLGALSNKQNLLPPVLMVDIGGGSTEFVWGAPQKPEGKISLPTGSVKLTEEFLKHDPPKDCELTALNKAVSDFLDQDEFSEIDPRTLVGVAGTVTTLAAMQLGMTLYDGKEIDGFRLSLREIAALIEKMRKMPARARLKLPGLTAGREDVILAGAVLLQKIMEKFGAATVIASDRGLRFGVILDFLRRGQNGTGES